jgi:hypothetical protein
MRVANLAPTKGISRENFIYRGLCELNVWDAGGQKHYIEQYFSDSQRELIFSEITATVFMVDSTIVEPYVKEIFEEFLMNTFEFSPHIEKIYVLLNKIDLQDSEEDKAYKLLSETLNEDLREKVEFTPVSVKEGSAQHRLIEILDQEIQKSTLSLQRLGKIRFQLDALKRDTLADYFVFNRPDGLLISSTIGKFESKPLEFMKFEIGTLDSNIYKIYKNILELKGIKNISPLDLSIIIYQSENSYVLMKDIANDAILLAVTKTKDENAFFEVMKKLNSEEFQDLAHLLREKIVSF